MYSPPRKQEQPIIGVISVQAKNIKDLILYVDLIQGTIKIAVNSLHKSNAFRFSVVQ